MITWGINALNHGSSLAVFSGGRLSMFECCKQEELDRSVIYRAFGYGGPTTVFWYERPWVKKLRQVRAGQWNRVFDFNDLPSRYIKKINIPYANLRYTPHHASHAAAGYYTSPFNHCAVVVLDAIGEFDCATIWEAHHGELRKVWSKSYPNSLGLFYSAFTDFLGMTPIKEEHLLQQMAEKGDPRKFRRAISNYFDIDPLTLNYNFHQGVGRWTDYFTSAQDRYDLAAAVQERFEMQVGSIMSLARDLVNTDSLVYMGGCAMNSQANRTEVEPKFKYIWSLPNPGDATSSIGAVLYHTKQRVWDHKWGLVKHIKISV